MAERNEKANSAKGKEDEAKSNEPPKTKAQLKAERRAIQEAQRLAKGGAPSGGKPQAQEKNVSNSSPADENAPPKTKAQLKAERRAIQEAQRLAKGGTASGAKGQDQVKGQASGKGSQANKTAEDSQQKKQPQASQAKKPDAPKPTRISTHMLQDDAKSVKREAKKLEKHNIPQRTHAQKKVGQFKHLHQYEREVSLTRNISFGPGSIHPATLKLGLQYAEGVVSGSNARCIALLALLKKIISDYKLPEDKEISRDLEARIKPDITFLQQCRQQSVSMGNAIKHIKWHITNTSSDLPEAKAKERLLNVIDEFYHKILSAGKIISDNARAKICDGDVLLVYACSSLIKRVLCDAYDNDIQFRVIVVDSRPKFEGREMLRRLVKHGIKCSYILINAASYVMREVTKVLLGTHALLSNGYVMSRIGSSQVAMVARTYNVPVLVCCETYKFAERVQTDSFVYNELGDPDDIVDIGRGDHAFLSDWRDISSLRLLNLLYDVTPPDLVTTVITELGFLPCTSVPVVLRVHHEKTEAELRVEY